MSHIVNAYGNKNVGYPKINLDHVAEFRPVKGAMGENAFKCYGIDGECLGTVGACSLEREPAAVIPDHSGTVLVGFWLVGDTMEIHRFPVLGWHVESKIAEPVICETLPETYCLEVRVAQEGTVKWIFPEDRIFESLEEATSCARECLIRARKKQEERNAKAG